MDRESVYTGTRNRASSTTSSAEWLDKNATNLNKQARSGKLDKGIGRDVELVKVEIVLSKRSKSNCVLLGEPGVGKSQLFRDLAHMIESEEYNGPLKGFTIYEISISNLVSGTRYRGDLEEKIREMMEEATSRKDVILAIDELHTIMTSAANGAVGVADAMKPHLSSGAIKVIGATTRDEWKIIEKDKAMKRRFVPIDLTELPMETILKIMDFIRPELERHHGIFLPQAVLKRIPCIAKEYTNIALPDSAIDLADSLGSFKSSNPARWKNQANSNRTTIDDLLSVCSLMYNVDSLEIKRFLKTRSL